MAGRPFGPRQLHRIGVAKADWGTSAWVKAGRAEREDDGHCCGMSDLVVTVGLCP